VPEVAAILLAAGIGAISGILTTSWKTRKDLESQYDIALRKHRITAYKELWKHLEPFADYSPPAKLTYDRLAEVSIALRQWYFQEGGIFLSIKTRGPYFNLQQALTELSDGHKGSGRKELDPDTSRIVRTLASRLRTSTTQDVATRVGPRLGPTLMSELRRRWHRLRRPIEATVDRRWAWVEGRAEPCYFVEVTNLSDREVEVTGIALDGVKESEIEPSLLVQAGEPREIAVKPNGKDGRPGKVIRVKVTLEGGKEIENESPPEVPMQTDALELPRKDRSRQGRIKRASRS
jgi:hypothetical protein